MFITQEGIKKIINIDSIRALRVLFTLLNLMGYEGAVSIKQEELAEKLNLKNKANVNIALSELIKENLIAKKTEGKKITYVLNPDYVVTQKGYKALKEQYKGKESIEDLINNFVGEMDKNA